MQTINYMADADRTAGGDFHADMVSANTLLDAIAGVQAVSPAIDNIKKALFYGKVNDDLEFAKRVAEPRDYNVDVDLIHAVLGIYTEAAELLELLGFQLAGEDVDRSKYLNEAGDGLWYNALLFKHLETNFEEVGELNIAKLRKRFPVKFTSELAVNRDEAKENVVFD